MWVANLKLMNNTFDIKLNNIQYNYESILENSANAKHEFVSLNISQTDILLLRTEEKNFLLRLPSSPIKLDLHFQH